MTGSDQVSRLLAAERAESPPPGVAEVGRARLLSSLAAEAQLPGAVGAVKLGWPLLAKWIGTGFAVGLAGAGVASYGTASRAEAPLALAPVPQVTRGAPPRGVEAAVMAAEAVSASSASPQHVSPPPQVSSPEVTVKPSADPAFDEEVRLLSAAKRELGKGRPHLARAWLHEHRARFVNGVFGVEREGLLVLASCSEQERPALAREFAARYPESAMVGQLLRRCGAEDKRGASPRVDFPEGHK